MVLVGTLGYLYYRHHSRPVTDVEFPQTALVDGLLSEPETLQRGARQNNVYQVSFVRWFDGTDVLLRTAETRAVALAADLRPIGEVELPGMPDAVLSVSVEGRTRLVVLSGPYAFHRAVRLSLVDEDGASHELLQSPNDGDLRSVALLTAHDGATEIVVGAGGAAGILAVGLDGSELWDIPNIHVIYEVCTHPDLRGWVLQIGWNARLFRERPGGAGPELVYSRANGIYVSQGTLVRSDQGRPLAVITGPSLPFDQQTVLALDELGRTTWKARVPFELQHFATLEVSGKRTVIAALGRTGDLVLFDVNGTLLTRTALPSNGEYAYDLVAGPMSDGSWALVAKSLNETYLFRIDASRLPDSAERR